MKNIDAIKPIQTDYLTVTWFVSSKCNYKCFYCIDSLNGGKHYPEDYVGMVKFILQLHNKYPIKKIKLFLMGGEVTFWDKLIPLVKELKNKLDIKILLISNGSQTIEWWNENQQYFDFINLSYHHQYANRDHFIKISKMINYKANILLMTDPINFKEIIDNGRLISKKSKIAVVPKLLRIKLGKEIYDYSDKQLEIFNETFGYEYYSLGLNWLTTLIKYRDNDEIKYKRPYYFQLKKYNRFKNWKCSGGLDNFFINDKGEIFVGQCRTGYLGNINEKKIKLPHKEFICDRETCDCSIDLHSTTKIK